MHFDDRLATVLRQEATSRVLARIQFRQLIDLLGQSVAPGTDPSPHLDAALARLRSLGDAIPADERAAILREPMTGLANARLVAQLASAEPPVAIAAIAAADLADAEWIALIPALPVQARGILRHRRGFSAEVEAVLERLGVTDRGLPPAAHSDEASIEAKPSPPAPQQRPELIVMEGGAGQAVKPDAGEAPRAGIGAIVQRIEAFRKAREIPERSSQEAGAQSGLANALVLSLDFTTDAEGRIDWTDGPLAPALVGLRLFSIAVTEGRSLQAAVTRHQPLRGSDVLLTGAPELAGTWRLDALPRFSGTEGRFGGYAGRLRRRPEAVTRRDELTSAADSMRQVLHELRTPANAIQVAAEIIQQQLYGPAPHEYRALAAAIAGDTAQILAGFEELDRLVRLESGVLSLPAGRCDLSALVRETVARLETWTAPRGSGFRVLDAPENTVTLEREEAARLVWRLLAALAGTAAGGEVIDLNLAAQGGEVVLDLTLPQPLAARLDGPMAADGNKQLARTLSAGIFGLGFTLRLAAAEAAAAGGALDRQGSMLRLTLPGLTLPSTSHTQI